MACPLQVTAAPGGPHPRGARYDAAVSALDSIREALAAHEAWRGRTLNLVASENVPHPSVQAALAPSLDCRYGDYLGGDPLRRKYRGQRHMAALEREVAALVGRAFGASEVELRPLGGHLAGVAVIAGLCAPGDVVLELDAAAGGHRTAEKLARTALHALEVLPVPWLGDRLQPDLPALERLMRARRPRLVILGSSCFLVPTELPPVAALCRELGCALVYDATIEDRKACRPLGARARRHAGHSDNYLCAGGGGNGASSSPRGSSRRHSPRAPTWWWPRPTRPWGGRRGGSSCRTTPT